MSRTQLEMPAYQVGLRETVNEGQDTCTSSNQDTYGSNKYARNRVEHE